MVSGYRGIVTSFYMKSLDLFDKILHIYISLSYPNLMISLTILALQILVNHKNSEPMAFLWCYINISNLSNDAKVLFPISGHFICLNSYFIPQ